MENKIRLQKAIASSGLCSRRVAEELIKKGKVIVNGKKSNIGDKVALGTEHIFINGKKIGFEEKEYYIFNKPKGLISTSRDDLGRKSVVDAIKTKKRIVPVGRLDKGTSGLLILTNDGDLVNKLTHPKFECEKEYEAVVEVPRRWGRGGLELASLKMKKGIKIAGGFKTKPAKVKILKKISANRYILSIVIHEGKKHQIRRMVNASGMSVMELKRVRVGKINLGDLKEGDYRKLSGQEVYSLIDFLSSK